MESKIKWTKCEQTEKIKNGFHRGKQRYKCKHYGCNYTGSKIDYPDHINQKAIKYLEVSGFRRIERLMYVSILSVNHIHI